MLGPKEMNRTIVSNTLRPFFPSNENRVKEVHDDGNCNKVNRHTKTLNSPVLSDDDARFPSPSFPALSSLIS